MASYSDIVTGGAIAASVVAGLKVIERMLRGATDRARSRDEVTVRELLETRFDAQDRRFDIVDTHNSHVDQRLDRIEGELATLRESTTVTQTDVRWIQQQRLPCRDCEGPVRLRSSGSGRAS